MVDGERSAVRGERELPPKAEAGAWAAIETVMDPEVPVLSVVELGIVRAVEIEANGVVQVTVTPTYSGCPAMHVIETELKAALGAAGFSRVEIRTVYAPAWTTDWISTAAREKLRAYGIAPPGPAPDTVLVQLAPAPARVNCPFCGSARTELSSEFGATACKSLHICRACHQPFEHFKAF